ncbi:MAG: hypothetical protein E7265_03765 [Lachnospiraceae bacterium]|nr:hypothetical protein [Lachnospiraceae bacterium]
MMKTVGELKEFIKDLPDDMLLANYESNMEISDYRNRLSCDVVNMKTKTKYSWDRFDGTDYSYEVLERAEDGVPCLIIS